MMTQASPKRRPALAESLAVLLVCAVVGVLSVSLLRYIAAHEYKQELVGEQLLRAERFAADWTVAGQGGLRADADFAAAYVVSTGGVDDYGMATATVAYDHVRDEAARPRDSAAFEDALITDNGSFGEQYQRALEVAQDHEGRSCQAQWGTGCQEATQRALKDLLPVTLRVGVAELADGPRLLSASALLTRQHEYVGFVRVIHRVPEAPEVIPWWCLPLALACAFLLTFLGLRRTRWSSRALGALAMGSALLLATGLHAPIATVFVALGGALLGALVTPSFAALLRALRSQPTTYLYIAPAMVGMVLLIFVPFAMGILIAFFDHEGAFVGLQNFGEVLAPSEHAPVTFWWTFGMTVLWTVCNVVLHVGIGLALALVLNRPKLRFRWLYRVLLILPWAVPNYVTALVWKGMFHTQYGAVNSLLGVVGVDKIDWLGHDVATNFLANLATNTWLGFPFMMVVALGALQAIPRDLYEAADMDGASRWQAFRHVTLPMLKPAMVPAIILGTIWTFNMFNVIYLVSGGGPGGKTDILITQAYHAFWVDKRIGFAAAYSLLIFLVLWAYGALTNRITRATEGAFE